MHRQPALLNIWLNTLINFNSLVELKFEKPGSDTGFFYAQDVQAENAPAVYALLLTERAELWRKSGICSH